METVLARQLHDLMPRLKVVMADGAGVSGSAGSHGLRRCFTAGLICCTANPEPGQGCNCAAGCRCGLRLMLIHQALQDLLQPKLSC